MNILFIWTGVTKPLYEWRMKCIRRALTIYPTAHFQVITTMKEFFNMQVIEANDISNNLNDEFSIGITLHDPICFSDYARYYWLARNPQTLYIDTDVFCVSPIPEIQDIGHDDYWAIWNGNNLKGIQDILAQHDEKRYLFHTPKLLATVGRNFSQYFIHKPIWRNY